jgi:tetratricopeptide (TPR) repeat protein
VQQFDQNIGPLAALLVLLATFGWARPAESVEGLMEKARQAQAAGAVDQAADLYRKVLRLRPHWGPAEYGLGMIATAQKNYSEAVELLSQALGDDASLVGAYLFRGIALLNLERPGEALPSLEHFYRVRPEDREVRFFLGGTYNVLGDYSKAAEFYAAQLKLTPERTDVWYFLGECLLSLPRRMKANLLNRSPKGSAVALLQAQAGAEKGDVAAAEKEFAEAINTEPSNPEGYVNLGNLFLGQGKHVQAKEQFRQALQHAPGNCRALEGLGDVGLATNEIEASIAQYAKVAGARDPCVEERLPANLGLSSADFGARLQSLSERGRIAKWKAAVNFELSRLKARASGSESAGASNPASQESRLDDPKGAAGLQPCSTVGRREWLSSPVRDVYIANCLEGRGDFHGAIKALGTAEPRSAGDPETAYWIFRLSMRLAQRVFAELANRSPNTYLLSEVRAELLELQGRDEDAEKEFRAAIRSSGNDPIPSIEFGRFKCKRNELDDAIASLKEALARAPYNARANDLIGEALFMKGDHASAIPHLQSAIAIHPANEDCRIRLAQSFAKLGRIKEAIAVLEAAPTDTEGRVHYVLAGYYRQEGKSEEMQRALVVFQTRQKALKAKVPEDPN